MIWQKTCSKCWLLINKSATWHQVFDTFVTLKVWTSNELKPTLVVTTSQQRVVFIWFWIGDSGDESDESESEEKSSSESETEKSSEESSGISSEEEKVTLIFKQYCHQIFYYSSETSWLHTYFILNMTCVTKYSYYVCKYTCVTNKALSIINILPDSSYKAYQGISEGFQASKTIQWNSSTRQGKYSSDSGWL